MNRTTSSRLFWCGLTAAAACNAVAAPQRPNVLLIVSEDNGLDLGCYGNAHVSTPHLDRLARQGVCFTQGYVPYSVSSPSRGVLFTGLYPHQNGQVGLATHNYAMYDGVKTLPKYLGELGYKTGCIGKIHVNPESEIPFDYWAIRGSNFAKKDLNGYARQASKFVDSVADGRPFFLTVNFPDAHFPVQDNVEGLPTVQIPQGKLGEGMSYVGVNSPRHRQYTTSYYNCMNRLDEAVGMLLDSMERRGVLDNTVVLYISDHGAQFPRAKGSNYEAALRVPFIAYWKGVTPVGAVRDEMISTVDFLPTFIALAGGTPPDFMPGRDLTPILEGKKVDGWRTQIFAGGMGSFPQVHYPKRSVREGQYKLIVNYNSPLPDPQARWYRNQTDHYAGGISDEELALYASDLVQKAYALFEFPPRYELYDLEADPDEWNNLADNKNYEPILERLKKALAQWQADTKDPVADPVLLAMWNQEVWKALCEGVNYKENNFRWGYRDYFSFASPYKALY